MRFMNEPLLWDSVYSAMSDEFVEPTMPEQYETIKDVFDEREQFYIWTLQNAINEGKVDINRKSRKFDKPDTIEVVGFTLKRIECTRCEKNRLFFHMDVVVIVSLLFSAYDRTRQRTVTERHCQWFRMRTYEDVQHLDITKDHAVEVMVYDKKDKLQGMELSNCLVPVLSPEEVEAEIERLLQRYKMAYAVYNCGPVNVWELARNMGLVIRYAKLSLTGTISSKLFLPGKKAYVYEYYGEHNPFPCAMNGQLSLLNPNELECSDKEDRTERYLRLSRSTQKIGIDIDKPTIMIDPCVCDTEVKENAAVMHESGHYELHPLFYYLQNYQKERLTAFCMSVEEYEEYEEERESLAESFIVAAGKTDNDAENAGKNFEEIDWVEWQARKTEAYGRMPAAQTKRKIKDLYKHYYNIYPYLSDVQITSHVISALALYYVVSKETARIRMIELGYDIARGVNNYLDGRYVPDYRTSTGKYRKNITYAISDIDAARIYAEDEKFRRLLDSGLYVSADNFFCLNRTEYIEISDGEAHLTDTARSMVDKCCISFRVRHRKVCAYYDKNALHSDATLNDGYVECTNDAPVEDIISALDANGEQISRLPATYGDTLEYHRKSKGISQEEFAWRLGITDRTLREYESNSVLEPSRVFFASAGRALHIPGVFTRDMMKKAVVPLDDTNGSWYYFGYVVDHMYMRKLKDCNVVLKHYKLPLLMGRDDDETAPQRRTGKSRKTKGADRSTTSESCVRQTASPS